MRKSTPQHLAPSRRTQLPASGECACALKTRADAKAGGRKGAEGTNAGHGKPLACVERTRRASSAGWQVCRALRLSSAALEGSMQHASKGTGKHGAAAPPGAATTASVASLPTAASRVTLLRPLDILTCKQDAPRGGCCRRIWCSSRGTKGRCPTSHVARRVSIGAGWLLAPTRLAPQPSFPPLHLATLTAATPTDPNRPSHPHAAPTRFRLNRSGPTPTHDSRLAPRSQHSVCWGACPAFAVWGRCPAPGAWVRAWHAALRARSHQHHACHLRRLAPAPAPHSHTYTTPTPFAIWLDQATQRTGLPGP